MGLPWPSKPNLQFVAHPNPWDEMQVRYGEMQMQYGGESFLWWCAYSGGVSFRLKWWLCEHWLLVGPYEVGEHKTWNLKHCHSKGQESGVWDINGNSSSREMTTESTLPSIKDCASFGMMSIKVYKNVGITVAIQHIRGYSNNLDVRHHQHKPTK